MDANRHIEPTGLHPVKAGKLAGFLDAQSQTIGCVESCTGGLLGAALTAIPGSSAWFVGGLITYSNTLKHQLAGVPLDDLDTYGAVSGQVAQSMAQGGQRALGSVWCVSITGIAGPEGGSSEKPVGTVWIGVFGPDQAKQARRFVFPGDRQSVRSHTVAAAIDFVIDRVRGRDTVLEYECDRFEG